MLNLKYKQKYLKYKYKYLHIKSQIGGADSYLWYADNIDSKFSMINIYQDKEQNKVSSVYNEFLNKRKTFMEFFQNKKTLTKDHIEIVLNGKIYNITYYGIKLLKVNFNYNHFNEGITFFKLPICMKFIEDFLYNFFDLSDIDLISVGSGNGLFEKCCEDVFGKEIICIDPSPLDSKSSGLERPYKEPTFSNVDEYLSSSKKKDKSILLLIWPEPSLNYDIKAILKLKPISFFIIYGKFPVACSHDLNELLYSEEKNITLKYKRLPEENYEKIAITTGFGNLKMESYLQPFNIKMSVCIKKTISSDIFMLNSEKKYTEIKSNYSYCKRNLISKLYYDLPPIDQILSLGDIVF